MAQDVYPMPADGWVCYHCGERFTTPGAARNHFGARPEATVACLIKYGEERGLVMELRKAEDEVNKLNRVIRNLRPGPGCYCEAGTGNQMVHGHTTACEATQKATREAESNTERG